jgi:dTDP-4-dehydrorhamnose reductase
MILLLGASGYVGQAFARELRRRRYGFIPLARRAFDYARLDLLLEYVRKIKPEFLINAAGFGGKPNMDACELQRAEAFQANAVLPQTIARVCSLTKTPWAHVSSGCIYSGAKVFRDGDLRVETDLNQPELRRLFAAHPERFLGFTEADEPNFSFRCPPCSFHAGTRALGEEALRGFEQVYVWRPRLPFSERDEPCNLLSKLQRYSKVYDHLTSLSHLEDCVRAGLDLWERNAPYGIYNLTNPGAVSTRQVVAMIQRIVKPSRRFDFWTDDQEFYAEGARAPRSSCILDVSKLLNTGVKLRGVEQALQQALDRWQPFRQDLMPSEPILPTFASGSP